MLLPAVALELVYPQMGAAGRELTRDEMRALALPFIGIGFVQIYGQLAMIAVATDNGRSTVGAAMARALGALPRVVLALLMFALGVAVLAFVLAMVLVIPTALVSTSPAQLQQTSSLLMLLLIVPIFYIGVRLSLLNVVAVTEEAGPAQALKRSWRATKGQVLPLVGLIVPTLCALLIAQGLVGMVTGGTARAIGAMLGAERQAQFVASLVTGTINAAGTAYFTMLFVSIWQRLRRA